MRPKAKIRNYGQGRLIVEIPKSIRHEFQLGQEVYIEKIKKEE